MILLIDNYDSFVFNLARYLQELGAETHVVRNDAVSIEEICRMAPEAIVLSPGPCTPSEAGVSMEVVRRLGERIPILGVCLGHQAIAAALGGEVVRAPEPVHGAAADLLHSGKGVFAGLPQPLRAGRYHSLIVDDATLPTELETTCRTREGLIMGLQHRCWPVVGVQFHPESILTPDGGRLLANFLRMAGREPTQTPPPELAPTAIDDDFYRQPITAGASRPW